MMSGETSVEKPKWLIASDAAQSMAVSRVAWIRVGALGDLLVAMACLKEMESFFPKAKVTVFGPKLWLDLIDPRLWKNVDSIVVIVDGDKGQKFAPKAGGWQAENEPTQRISAWMKGCQASVNLRVESLRYGWPPFFAGVKYRFGTCQPGMRWLYSRWSPWLGKDPILHERDRMLEILEAPTGLDFKSFSTKHNRAQLKLKQTGKPNSKPDKFLVFQKDQSNQSLAKKWQSLALPQIVLANPVLVREKYKLTPGKYWLINPTSSRWEKAWPKEKFKSLCKELLPLALKAQKEIVVIGAPNETDWLSDVADSHETGIRVVQPGGLKDLMHVVALANALIANTSSVQFIAAATKTKCFTLMGRTFPARWGPLGAQDGLVFGRQQDPPPADIFMDDYTAYDSLSVEEVFSALNKWL